MNEEVVKVKKTIASGNRTPYIGIDEWIQKMKLAFSNAKIDEIYAKISPFGYTNSKLEELLQEVEQLEAFHQRQKIDYATQYEKTQAFTKKQEQINQLYGRHIALCKILFKGHIKATTALELSGRRKVAYASWYQQVSNFYAQLVNDQEFLAKVNTISIDENELKGVQTQLQELLVLKEAQKKSISEAQKATVLRDECFERLYPKYSEFISYAKVALSASQELEALGIIARR